MKIVLSESQYRRLIETKEEGEILKFPSLEFFDKDREVAWNIIQKIVEKKGNIPFAIDGDLYLMKVPIKSLGNLISVGGNLDLKNTPIESLGNLTSVGGYLSLANTPIESLGNLTSVGGDLFLRDTPISKMYSKQEVSQLVNVNRKIYLKAPGKS